MAEIIDETILLSIENLVHIIRTEGKAAQVKPQLVSEYSYTWWELFIWKVYTDYYDLVQQTSSFDELFVLINRHSSKFPTLAKRLALYVIQIMYIMKSNPIFRTDEEVEEYAKKYCFLNKNAYPSLYQINPVMHYIRVKLAQFAQEKETKQKIVQTESDSDDDMHYVTNNQEIQKYSDELIEELKITRLVLK